jgi:hypothetical protein
MELKTGNKTNKTKPVKKLIKITPETTNEIIRAAALHWGRGQQRGCGEEIVCRADRSNGRAGEEGGG